MLYTPLADCLQSDFCRLATVATVCVGLLAVGIFPKAASSQEPPSLAELASPTGLRIGFEVSPEILGDLRYTNLIKREANAGTVGVFWKQGGLHDIDRDTYQWDRADSVVGFLQQANKEIYGTPLYWPADIHTPAWVLEIQDPRELREVLEEHIATVVGRYAGTVKQWVVVNEAFAFDGSLQTSHWAKGLGTKGIRWAFEAAAAADPTAELIINDYGMVDKDARKFQAVRRQVRALRRAGVKVDGIGFQMHVSAGEVLDPDFPLEERLRSVLALGIKPYLTELDIVVADRDPTLDFQNQPVAVKNEKNLQIQKDAYKKVVEIYRRTVPDGSIQVWGITDIQSWLGEQRFPLLFDTDVMPKPAYFGVSEALMGDIQGQRRLNNVLTDGYLGSLNLPIRTPLSIAVVNNATLPFFWFFFRPDPTFDAERDRGQVWSIVETETKGIYRLQSKETGKYLSFGTRRVPWLTTEEYAESSLQTWRLRELSRGRYLIQHSETRLFLQPGFPIWMFCFPTGIPVTTKIGPRYPTAIWHLEFVPKSPDTPEDLM